MEEKSVLEVKMEEVAEDQGSRWPRWSFVGGLVMGLMICLEIVSSPRGLRTRAPADMLERSLRWVTGPARSAPVDDLKLLASLSHAWALLNLRSVDLTNITSHLLLMHPLKNQESACYPCF